jgi:hypothetical protein
MKHCRIGCQCRPCSDLEGLATHLNLKLNKVSATDASGSLRMDQPWVAKLVAQLKYINHLLKERRSC